MPTVSANGIELAYEVEGTGPPLLLIMGLGGQLTDWPAGFVTRLATHFQVIRFDNRDAGLSTFSSALPPTKLSLVKARLRPASASPPYQLDDMAADTAALLTALGIANAHIVGMSMGAMIAQLLTIQRPELVSTLTSIMSTTGNPRVGQPTLRVLASLARRNTPNEEQTVAATLELFAMVGGRDWDRSEQRERTSMSVARSFNPNGVLRQSMAIACAKDRTERLQSVTAPTLVIHGLDDALVRPSGGRATAEALAESRLLMFPRMGHDIPATRHDEIVEAIVAHASR